MMQQPRTDLFRTLSSSCEAAHADVLQPVLVVLAGRLLDLPGRGLPRLLPLLRHTAHHEHTIPGDNIGAKK